MGRQAVDRRTRRVAGGWAFRMAMREGLRNVVRRPVSSLALSLSVSIGVALALAIIAASNGVDDRVSLLLNVPQLPPQIDLKAIHDVLQQTRRVLTGLALAVTAALAGFVTWMSLGRRRREIGVKRHFGMHIWEVIAEFSAEGIVLCVVGGFAGIGLGHLLCRGLHLWAPALPLRPKTQDTLWIFPVAVTLSFLVTSLVAWYLALYSSSEPEL